MNSVEKVKKLCSDRHIAIARLERDLGFSNGYIARLRKGEFPSNRLRQIADYFEIPIDRLFGDDVAPVSPDVQLDAFQYALYNETQKLTEEKKKLLLDLARSMTKE